MRITGLRKAYGERVIFDGLDLEIPEGKITCVLGESGVGKTTLLKILGGLTDYTGEIEGKKKAAFVFQEPRLIAHMSVYENIEFAVGRYEGIEETLALVGLENNKMQRAGSLSGGEAQRVALARAFLFPAPLVLLDEPFSSLDTGNKLRVMKAFHGLFQRGKKTAVLVTHDLDEALALGHKIVLLKKGGKAEEYFLKGEPLREYGNNRALREQLLGNDKK